MFRRVLFAVLLVLGVLAPARGSWAEDPPAPPAAEPGPGEPGFEPTRIPTPTPDHPSLYAVVDIAAHGDAKARIEIHFAEENWAKLRKNVQDPRKFLQDMRPNRSDSEVAPDAEAGFDDKARAVILIMNELGAVRGTGECGWALVVGAGYTLRGSDTVDGRPRAFFEERGRWANGMEYVGRYTYLLPEGATEANWDAPNQALTWVKPCEPGSGPARLTTTLKVKDRLMTSVYKVYGLGGAMAAQWVAKMVVKNTGPSRVRNLKVRFKLDKYSEWSGWQKFPEVVQGQTVVALYNPVLDASVARLKSNTPADLHVAWSYEDAAGVKHEDDDTRRVVLLGVNEFVFSNLVAGESFGTWSEDFNNAPLLAAWVSRNDAVVKQFAAMANRLAGGVGANTDVESAVKVLRACYDLLLANDFTYQHPPALPDKSVSFDVRQVQNVKFPRDTIRDRSGTCIDLAILYAAMVNAVGLEPHLALIPGHCFPVVRLPNGNLVAVEVTGVAGGLRFGSADFDTMLPKGIEELREAFADGRLYLIDLRDLWTRGIANPELDEHPADILEKWGITETGRGRPRSPEPQGDAAVLGVFAGTITEEEDGETTTHPIVVGLDPDGPGKVTGVVRVELDLPSEADDDKTIRVVFLEWFEAKKEGDGWSGRATKRKIVNPGTKEEQEQPTKNRIVFKAADGKLVGKLGNDEEGWTEFALPRKPQ